LATLLFGKRQGLRLNAIAQSQHAQRLIMSLQSPKLVKQSELSMLEQDVQMTVRYGQAWRQIRRFSFA